MKSEDLEDLMHSGALCVTEREWALLRAANQLMDLLGQNTGLTPDWPIKITFDDLETGTRLLIFLNGVQNAMKAYGIDTGKPDP